MKLDCHFVTDDFRGDHSADVRIAFVVRASDTIQELVDRIVLSGPRVAIKSTDVIELRLAVPVDAAESPF